MRKVVPPARPIRRAGRQDTQLSTQANALYCDVVRRSSDTADRLMLLLTLARNHAASSADVRKVRELLVADPVRGCGDTR